LKILFIGGTGVISSACSTLCVEKGYQLHLLNRGNSFRPIPENANLIKADIKDKTRIQSRLKDHYFDVIVDWIAYNREDVQRDFELFRGKTSQYIFISSASVYAKPPQVPIGETHSIDNPFWTYSQNKILCEEYLKDVRKKYRFPVTIVRPSHTYDKTKIPLHGGYTTLNRLLTGKKIIVHGDGTALWTLTHHLDFAQGFIGILGKSEAVGEVYHITGDEVLTWDQIAHLLARAAGVEANIVHIPSDFIHHHDPEWGTGLLGDKAYSMVFDNTKIKKINPEFLATISFAAGAAEIYDWYQSNDSHKVVNHALDQSMDNMISKYETTWKDSS
jgi:nucleoside-diphosphate-sugar epimerase